MSLEEAFLNDIIANPDEDGPRLVFADWLDDNGDPARAEFIRLQCERARLPPDDPRSLDLELRVGELLGAHEPRWRAPLPKLPGITWGGFERGFVNHVMAGSVR